MAIHYIPYLDGDWLGYGPLDPQTNFGLLPPDAKQIHANLRASVGFWKSLTGGKVVFGAHSGTYCRELFYEPMAIEIYHELIANGGEIAVHPHEERVNGGHIIEHLDHMRYIISWKRRQLLDSGITPTAFRLPYNGYVSGITEILEGNELLVDLSGAPEFVNEYWRSNWEGAPASAWFLGYDDHADPAPKRASRVLEVPLGWDGVAPKAGHYLFCEQTELDRLKQIWDAIVQRSEREGPQMVYFLCHLHAMPDPELSARIRGLVDHAEKSGALAITPSEAYAMQSELAAA